MALKLHYQVMEDWDANRYCGLTLTWDYTNRTMDLAMPGYIDCALKPNTLSPSNWNMPHMHGNNLSMV